MKEVEVFSRLESARIIAVLIIDRAEDAVPVGEALFAGGIKAMELTLRTPAALDALREIKRAVPQMIAGVGTVLRPDQVMQVVEAGGDFAVAPGMSRRVVEAALTAGLPFAPGICTPSDIEAALEYDRLLLKFFPAEPSGGRAYLRVIAAPYAHLGIKFIPLGGLTVANMGSYLEEPHIAAIGGSWLAPREMIRDRNWEAIRAAAAEASGALRA
jgi:2-dehydro-3-deoxyphosphogluconate aldolase / (4S)-4-hydroxy-2-oxoglutarate aldolase